MWNAGPTILEGENEELLRDEFARLVAKYPHQDTGEIGQYVFRNLKDPGLRGAQAAMFWMNDVATKELIRQYQNGKDLSDLPTKDDAARLAWAIASDQAEDTKDRVKALELFGQLNGMIVKSIDKKVDDVTRRVPPTVVFAQYAD